MRIQLVPITVDEIKQYVTVAFDGDSDLLNDLHVSPGDLEHCVNHTVSFITENKDFFGAKAGLYKVRFFDRGTWIDIGYTVTIQRVGFADELYSFGINRLHRSKELLSEWLREIDKVLSTPYFVILWDKNQRAIKFFEKNGFIVEAQDDQRKKLIIKFE